jgi:rhodanese-related sulfurtransferase
MTSSDKNAMPPAAIANVRDIDVRQAAALAGQGALLLDVREPGEWAAGHIAGATHMPLGDLDPASVPAGTSVVAVCRSGNRSSQAALELLKTGRDAVNMAGGMLAWQKAGLPVVSNSGEPGAI